MSYPHLDLRGFFGLSVNDFLKNIINKVYQRGIEKIGQMAINLANYEGLHATHYQLVKG